MKVDCSIVYFSFPRFACKGKKEPKKQETAQKKPEVHLKTNQEKKIEVIRVFNRLCAPKIIP